jgi:hypothetical protein
LTLCYESELDIALTLWQMGVNGHVQLANAATYDPNTERCYRRGDGGVVKLDCQDHFASVCMVPGCARFAHGKGGVGARCSKRAHNLK